MPTAQPSLIARDDTLFGVCQALGDDFGFSPNWLRVGLAALLYLNPIAALGGYAAAGALVLLSRLLVPDPRPAAAAAGDAAPEPSEANDAAEPAPVPLAA